MDALSALGAVAVWLVAGWTFCDLLATRGTIPASKAPEPARSVLRLSLLMVAGLILVAEAVW